MQTQVRGKNYFITETVKEYQIKYIRNPQYLFTLLQCLLAEAIAQTPMVCLALCTPENEKYDDRSDESVCKMGHESLLSATENNGDSVFLCGSFIYFLQMFEMV